MRIWSHLVDRVAVSILRPEAQTTDSVSEPTSLVVGQTFETDSRA